MNRPFLLAGLLLLLPLETAIAVDNIHISPVIGCDYSHPQGASVPIGILLKGLWGVKYDASTGLLLQLEPGQNAQKMNIGLGALYTDGQIPGSWSIRFSVLQTTNNFANIDSGQTYLGAELAGSMLWLGGRFGIYAHVGGEKHDAPIVFLSIGAGSGFP